MSNTDVAYWLVRGFSLSVAKSLAYIAGDYANMSDDAVLETYQNEQSGS